MAYEFTKLADVPALEEVPEGANAFIEVDGEVRRVPGDGLGGGGGESVATLDFSSGEISSDGQYIGICSGMTFEQAYERMMNGESIVINVLTGNQSSGYRSLSSASSITISSGSERIQIKSPKTNTIWWTASGISSPVVE